jgi:hypothetical protein
MDSLFKGKLQNHRELVHFQMSFTNTLALTNTLAYCRIHTLLIHNDFIAQTLWGNRCSSPVKQEKINEKEQKILGSLPGPGKH